MKEAAIPVPGEEGESEPIIRIREALKNALPCPFCGGEPVIDSETKQTIYREVDDSNCRTTWCVRCRSCAASGPWSKYAAINAIVAWNRRR